MNKPIDPETLWNAMPSDVQRKISCHDLKRIADNLNRSHDLDGRDLKSWLSSKMKQVRVNVAARDLIKSVESTTDEFLRNGCRLRDNDYWCKFYVAMRNLDSENTER